MSAPSTTPSTTPQEAFAAGDAVASREVHEKKGDPASPGSAPEVHGGVGSENIKSLIFGGVDGAITTFSTIASVAGGQMTVPAVLVLGFANLIAGIAMVRVGRHPALAPRPNPHPLPPPWHTIFTSSSLPTLARYLTLLSLSLLPLPSPPQPNTPSFVHSPSTLFVLRIISFVFVGALSAILTPSLPPLHAPLPHASVLVSFSTPPSRRCGGSPQSTHRFV